MGGLSLSCACGGDSPTGSSSSPTNLSGNWTYRQQAPASCPLPTTHRSISFPATIAAQGGNVYVMTLSGTDRQSSYSYFYWAGGSYKGNLLYTRTTASELAVFTVVEAVFSTSANSISGSVGGEYQYLGATIVDCIGTFAITLTR